MKHNFEKFCKDYENIENYDKAKADNFKGWNCHHRKGVDIPKEELIAIDMYYNRPADELIFLKISEHSRLHNEGENNPMYGKRLSEESKKKIGEKSKGNKYFLGKKHSDEAKKKMSCSWDYDKHFSIETKERMSNAMKGRHWYNNGKENKHCYECPEGFVPGRIKKPEQ